MPEPAESDSRQPEPPERAESGVSVDPDFYEWRDRLPSFELDGERLYLPTGDVPVDEEQLVEMWVRRRSTHRSDDAPTDASGACE
jgi:hypothetical protein